MNAYSTRVTVGITAIILAAAISFAVAKHEDTPGKAAAKTDPSVPPASEVFKSGQHAEGNVPDHTY
jgi:hypothetical protein